jgi:hypothetical protein
MADNRRDEPGSKAAVRSRAPEFSPAEAQMSKISAATAAQPDRTKISRVIAARSKIHKVSSARKSTPVRRGAAKKVYRKTAAERALVLEKPVKTAPLAELSEYVVSVNNKTGVVVKIEKFTAASGERKPLSQPEYARVAPQLSTAARPLAAALTAQAAAAVPAILNAPAFNALAAQASSVPPALTQRARSANANPATAASDAAPAAPDAQGADTTAVMQAYFQGVLDYLNALAAPR